MFRGISSKDSNYEMEGDDKAYEDNVDQYLEWLGVENKRNIGNKCGSEVDNSDRDAAPDSEYDFLNLHRSDEEQYERPPMFNPKNMDNPHIEL